MSNRELKQLSEMPRRCPTSGTFELTVRCNLHCKMCLFRHDDKENPDIIRKELSAAQWIDMARQAAEAGTVQLLITGGEPMLRPDFCEIWEGIYKQGFLITLYTNATLVTPKVMETLRKYPPHRIGVTIYGATPETYEKVCGNAEAFRRAVEGMHELQKLPSIMEFRMTIIKDNYHEVDAIERLVREEFGEEYLLTHTKLVTKAVRGACSEVEKCRLEPEKTFELEKYRTIELLKRKVGDYYDESNVRFEKTTHTRNVQKRYTLLGCDTGMSSYAISWDGKLLGCQILGAFYTDALKEGFNRAWEEYPYQIKILPKSETCNKCRVKSLCECCYAFRYSETGSVDGVPEYICQSAQALAKLTE